MTQAALVYNEGSHSKSYASITLTKGTGRIRANTAFVGTTMDGQPIKLLAYEDYDQGETSMKMRYATSDIQAEFSFCNVGANPDPMLEGCLIALGTITLDGIATGAILPYDYNPTTDNGNGRTLAGFSTGAQKKMGECGPQCPYNDYSKFLTYYGEFDYGHQFVTAAFERNLTTFAHGNIDFGVFSEQALHRAIQVLTLNMNVWMYVVREFEDALDDCAKGCSEDQCNTDKVNAWDEGVAFYVGSLQGQSGDGQGYLGYQLANDVCQEFRTCGEDGQQANGTALVNILFIEESKVAIEQLVAEQCVETRVNVERIVRIMLVPLVQATIRATYASTSKSGNVHDVDIARGEASSYVATLLPYIYNCSQADAEFLYEQLDYANPLAPDFEAIKATFERNYECLGITCEDVGGLWDSATGAYRQGASPCASSQSSSATSVGVAAGLTIVALFAVVAAAIGGTILYKRRKNTAAK